MQTHIRVKTYPCAEASLSEQNQVYVTGETDSKRVNIDFALPLLYMSITPEEALDLACALQVVARALTEGQQE